MSDTPRTDKHELEMSAQYELARECGWPPHDITNIADFARQLERELNAAMDALRSLEPYISEDSDLCVTDGHRAALDKAFAVLGVRTSNPNFQAGGTL